MMNVSHRSFALLTLEAARPLKKGHLLPETPTRPVASLRSPTERKPATKRGAEPTTSTTQSTFGNFRPIRAILANCNSPFSSLQVGPWQVVQNLPRMCKAWLSLAGRLATGFRCVRAFRYREISSEQNRTVS